MGSSSSSSSPTEAAVSSFLEGIASGTVASPPSATLESYLGDVVEGRVSLPSTPDAITSYMDAATSKSTSIDTTTDEEGMVTVTKVTRLVIEDVEEELLGEITEVCAAPAAIASFSGERSEAVGSVSPSTECASAITNYLDALSSGAVEPSRLASAGISSYLDTISDGVGVSGGGSGIASYVDGVGSAGALDFSGAVEASSAKTAKNSALLASKRKRLPLLGKLIRPFGTGESASSDYMERLSTGQASTISATSIDAARSAAAAGVTFPAAPSDEAMLTWMKALAAGDLIGPTPDQMQGYMDACSIGAGEEFHRILIQWKQRRRLFRRPGTFRRPGGLLVGKEKKKELLQ